MLLNALSDENNGMSKCIAVAAIIASGSFNFFVDLIFTIISFISGK